MKILSERREVRRERPYEIKRKREGQEKVKREWKESEREGETGREKERESQRENDQTLFSLTGRKTLPGEQGGERGSLKE